MGTHTHTLPLSSLKFGHDKKAKVSINARKTNRLEGIDTLARSIKHVGLVLPLAVVENGSGYHVVDGNRRLAALQQLVQEKVIPADHPIPVLVHNDKLLDAKSLAANVTALPLHPVDKFERFNELLQTMSEQEIADAFSLKEKEVRQVLALGQLSDKVLAAWREGAIDGKCAEAFTLAPKKRQDEVLAKLTKAHSLSSWSIKNEIVGDNKHGKLLEFVGVEAYEKAGGKVTTDLFGSDHIVSDPVLLKQLADDAIEAKKAALIADGWSFAGTEDEVGNRWTMHSLNVKPKFTKEQEKRVKEIEKILDGEDDVQHDYDALQTELDALLEAGTFAGFTPEQKKKSGCVLFMENGVLSIDYGRVKSKAAKPETATAKSKKKAAPEGAGISNALTQRLSEQLSDAIAECLRADPDLALAAVVAGFGANQGWGGSKPISVQERGLRTKQGVTGKPSDFASTLKGMIDGGRQNALNALAVIAARAVDTQMLNGQLPLKEKGVAALANATKAAAFRKALADRFDAKDYFASINKATALKAVEETVGKDEARKLNAKPKADITKYCLANVPSTGWLPPELRTGHYNGPGK